MRRLRLSMLYLSLSLSNGVHAMHAMQTPADVVARSASATLLVRVDTVDAVETTRFHRTLRFTASVAQVLSGAAVQAGTTLDLVYSEGRVHQRGDLTVAPLVTGSGIEFGLRTGDCVQVLLGAQDAGASDWSALRVDALASGCAAPEAP